MQEQTETATVVAAETKKDFSTFNLPQALKDNLTRMQYSTPTPIQAEAIPVALEGRDILACAQTGTGKTAAFAIPLVTKLLSNPRGSALVMTPTRELATQVMGVIKQMLGNSKTLNTALLIGGESMGPQFIQLRNRPRIIVGTPGRINDHIERGTLMLHDASFLVLDETDRMLDMGFSVQLDQIARFLPKVRQTLMFSATMPANIMKVSAKYLNNPERITIGDHDAPPQISEKLEHAVVHTEDANKYELLMSELQKREGSVIIFVKTKRGAERLSIRLNKQKMDSDTIHGDLKQSKRDRVIAAFRDCRFRILVATDVAARGLDIDHIRHVINFDLPHAAEDYVHRIGRTARAGAEGSAISLISPEDRLKWRAIQRLMDPAAAKAEQEAAARRPRPEGAGNRRRRFFRPRKPGVAAAA
ncbi:MAG TPA: DEAD/DEAH box helicase [Rickettsiales bacterium]|nr:DEAD/DEAH box helicase [Rickettsiales bacterium]